MMTDIQVWADFQCPFCYIGKKKLWMALQVLGIPDARVTVRSFLLDPYPTEENGISLLEYVAGQYADEEETVREGFRLREEEGREIGLHMDMLKARYSDTRDAHRLFQFAKTRGLGSAFFDRAQRALFEEGLLLSDPEVLLRLAQETGLGRREAREVLGSDLYHAENGADDREARAMNIDYVPYYIGSVENLETR
jgi:predicted DsbA family dithiol-disulfide isomerase